MDREITFLQDKNNLENLNIEKLFKLVNTPNFKESEVEEMFYNYHNNLHQLYVNYYSPNKINILDFNNRIENFKNRYDNFGDMDMFN